MSLLYGAYGTKRLQHFIYELLLRGITNTHTQKHFTHTKTAAQNYNPEPNTNLQPQVTQSLKPHEHSYQF